MREKRVACDIYSELIIENRLRDCTFVVSLLISLSLSLSLSLSPLVTRYRRQRELDATNIKICLALLYI